MYALNAFYMTAGSLSQRFRDGEKKKAIAIIMRSSAGQSRPLKFKHHAIRLRKSKVYLGLYQP